MTNVTNVAPVWNILGNSRSVFNPFLRFPHTGPAFQPFPDGALRNLWLLTPAFHSAYREGHVGVLTGNQRPYRWDEPPLSTDTVTKVHLLRMQNKTP